MPAEDSPLFEQLRAWFRSISISPQIVGTSTNPLVLSEAGVIVVPTLAEQPLRLSHKSSLIGRTDEVHTRIVALTTERNPRHPGVQAILRGEAARSDGRRKA